MAVMWHMIGAQSAHDWKFPTEKPIVCRWETMSLSVGNFMLVGGKLWDRWL